jgi:RHS repeat-associated protein
MHKLPPPQQVIHVNNPQSKYVDLSKPIGEIQGNVNTTPTGGVGYSIPIFTSPGTNGLQPHITLSYNSQTADGIAGLGWNLSGFSIISRAGKNFYHNGKVQPVTFTASDMFLMDGTKLNAITGNNGANGTIYACETESFAKIVSNSSASADNPDWFGVTNNDGTKMEYGNSVNSKLLTDDGLKTMYWRLNRIIDVNGNFIDFVYETVGRDSRIKQIKYTGNVNTGLQPYNFIDYNYVNRNDGNTSYDGGASLSSSSLLKSIKIIHTKDNGIVETVRKYVLNHVFDNVRTKLVEIIEYSGEETAPSLNSTAFTYGDESAQEIITEPSYALIPPPTDPQDLITGDYNGDGKADVMVAKYHFGNWGKIYSSYDIITGFDNGGNHLLYTENFFEDGMMNPNMSLSGGSLFSADYNKDGRDDVIYVTGSQSINLPLFYITKVVLKKTASTDPYTNITSVETQEFPPPPDFAGGAYQYTTTDGKKFINGDFDGDGNQDYILIASRLAGEVGYYPFDYKAFFTSPATQEINFEIQNVGIGGSNNAESVVQANNIIPIDFDGDGKTELLITKDNYSYIMTFNRLAPSTGLFMAATIIYTTPTINKDCRAYPGDFNGDKKTDLLMHYDNNTWGILYSNGISYDANAIAFNFNQTVATGNNFNVIDNILIADFNGDGKSDILHGYNNSGGKLSLYYSRGRQINNAFHYQQYNCPVSLSFLLTVGDFNADGRADFITSLPNLYANTVFIKPHGQEKLLTNITTGHNVSTDFQYKLLTDETTNPRFYNRTISLDNPANANPFNYIRVPMYALYKTIIADGVGGNNITEFSYENALVHRAAKGFLGFEFVRSKNNITGITSVSQNAFNTQYAVPYSIKQTKILSSTNFKLAETLIDNTFINLSTNAFDKRFLMHIDRTRTFDYINGNAIQSNNTYDNYGNITINITKKGYGGTNNINAVETIKTTTTYSTQNTNVPAKADEVIIVSTRTGKPDYTKTNYFTYDIKGRLEYQTDFANTQNETSNELTYNAYGNVITSTKYDAGFFTLLNTNSYDSKGRFILQKQISGGINTQKETFVIDTKWGVPLSNTSSDCLTTSYEYDVFGRLNKTIFTNGNYVTLTNTWQQNADNLFYVTEHSSGGSPDKKKYFDKWGKTWKEETASMVGSNNWHTKLFTYDNRGNVKTTTNSFFPNVETPRITTNYFDIYNRPSTTANYRGTTYFNYTQVGNGKFKISITGTDGNITSQTTDASGKTVSTTDNGGTLNFDYNSIGNKVEVNNNGIIVMSANYDMYGNQTSMTDIDAGTTSYNYDFHNRLSSQTDAKNNTYYFVYDDLGRLKTRTGAEGTTTYQYYIDPTNSNCSNNSIKKVIGFNGITKTYNYDALKRLQSFTETGIGGMFASRTTSYTYDANSALATTTYPNGVTIYNYYDANGYLIKKTSASFNSGILFQNLVIDGEGKYISYMLGNGKTTTKSYNYNYPATTSTPGVQNMSYYFLPNTGNLMQRSDLLRSQTETFGYDNLNRLKTSTVNGIVQTAISFDGNSSSSMGNISTKTDAGYYTYLNTKKHAVAFITETATPYQSNVYPAPVSVISHDEQNITYTAFLKPAVITDGISNVVGGSYPFSLNFVYGPDYERVQTTTQSGNRPIVRKYFAQGYEEETTMSSNYQTIFSSKSTVYVNAGDGLCAMVVTSTEEETTNQSTQFVYTDYLGSILALTDNYGSVIAAANYDAWGRERLVKNWNVYAYASGGIANNRGFTGHEMLSSFGLINMNGRLYDPIMGRMLSPDNFVSNISSTQGYNRYSYGLNNPLVYTDPDGNLPVIAIIGIFAAVHVTADLIRHDFKMNFGEIVGSTLTGALSGALSAFGAGAITTGGAAFVTAVAAELPGINIPITDGFSIGLSPAVGFGSGGWSFGASMSINASIEGVELGFGLGGQYGKDATTGVKGFSSRTSSMIGFRSGDVSFGIGQSNFNSGATSQSVGMAYAGVGDFKIRYENDWMGDKSPIGDKGDKYRTAAATISYKEISMGMNLFTGAPAEIDGVRQKNIAPDGRIQYKETGQQFRMGALYVGFGNTRVGVNTEGVRNAIQNHFVHKDGRYAPIFEVLNISDKPYIQYQTRNKFTSW